MSNSIDSNVDGAIQRLADRRPDAPGNQPGGGASTREATSSSDLLNLTGQAQTLKALEQDLAKSPEFDAERVAELKQALSSGQYRVDARTIAEKLLAMESKLP